MGSRLVVSKVNLTQLCMYTIEDLAAPVKHGQILMLAKNHEIPNGELVWDALRVCRLLQIDEVLCSMVCREVLEF